MTVRSCRRAFEKGQADRRAHPLTSGAYKLRDVIDSLTKDLAAINEIRDYLLNRKGYARPAYLVRCTSDDMAIWLKGLPEDLAHQFGYDVLPAIDALQGDGVPHLYVDAAVRQFTRRIHVYVDDCEIQRIRLKSGIAGEYASIRSGYSDLYGLITNGLRITHDALQVSDQNKSSLSAADMDALHEIRLETL
ncbi:hypothetical protein [Roseicyclus marinus]|uniref:Uncharacterized protein n=1 Tax=Roseicyclus marinus TaxID=2161673 RepID=A0AA48HE68_9RHOB|nr:hypothetical protein MACH21_28100 [Roseicyclus marinus]